MKKFSILICFFVFQNVIFAQNERDRIICDSIFSIELKGQLTKQDYEQMKNYVARLERMTGEYEPDELYQLLPYSYKQGDLSAFKKGLTILVEKYGFQVAYMNESLPYYDALMKGELSKWFKKMYLKKHPVWLKNNFDKQADLRTLNGIFEKDQLITRYSMDIQREILATDTILGKKFHELWQSYSFKDIETIYKITKKWDTYPSAKGFALIQRPFGIAEFHSYKNSGKPERTWDLLFPYYKKAYLKNEITYMVFKNYDNASFMNFGYQHFGLLKIEEIPKEWRDAIPYKEAPVKDVEYMEKIKKEFGWY